MCKGWQKIEFTAAGLSRSLLYKSPGRWRKGVILVLHGGGGEAAGFCDGGLLMKPQVEFTAEALSRGFAVMALESTADSVCDAQDRPCGKRFDFSVLPRPNVDLPYIAHILNTIIPSKRPAWSNKRVFIVGISTGGFMAVRAATHFDKQFTAFATVSAGDPYGTYGVFDPKLNRRTETNGKLVDRETGKSITEVNSCLSVEHPNESPWESQGAISKPWFFQAHHEDDSLVDISCAYKLAMQAAVHGYSLGGNHYIKATGNRSPSKHLWQSVYNKPILDFFERQ